MNYPEDDDKTVIGSVVEMQRDETVLTSVESDDETHMLFVDGGGNRVGIGTDSPVAELEVIGAIGFGSSERISQPRPPSGPKMRSAPRRSRRRRTTSRMATSMWLRS